MIGSLLPHYLSSPHLQVFTSEVPIRLVGHGPGEFAAQGRGEDLFDWGLSALAPGDCDAGVHIINLAGT